MADAADHPAWRAFMADLAAKRVDFALIRDCDDGSRSAVIKSVPNLSDIDRAIVSATWARLATEAANAAGSNNGSFAGANRSARSTSQRPQYGDSGSYPSPPPQAAAASPQDLLSGSPVRGAYSSGTIAADPASLRASLGRGDSTAALPLASELLQHDPSALCMVLQEYLPHMTVEQVRSVLGVGTAGMSAMESSPTGGAAAQGPTLNGKPIGIGSVLTAQGLAAQFGHGFTATCNGQYLSFPHTVQRGDAIVCRPLNERFL